jgi:hypothetical protein
MWFLKWWGVCQQSVLRSFLNVSRQVACVAPGCLCVAQCRTRSVMPDRQSSQSLGSAAGSAPAAEGCGLLQHASQLHLHCPIIAVTSLAGVAGAVVCATFTSTMALRAVPL